MLSATGGSWRGVSEGERKVLLSYIFPVEKMD
jgi:hypothetical protein